MTDWIQIDRYQQIATFSYAPEQRMPCDYAMYPVTLDLNSLKDGDTIYTAGFNEYQRALLDVVRNTDKKVILISSYCDHRVDYSFVLPDNVIRWYASNVDVINPRIESIPFGIESDWNDGGKHKKEKMLLKLEEKRNIRNLVYLEHSLEYNREERTWIYQLLENKPWVTAVKCKTISFDEYIDNVYNHKFVICPMGNGMGTHREWETLYLNTIPIQRRDLNNRFYTDLPICFVDNWDELTEDFLNSEYERITHGTWKMEMLTFGYWKNKILSTIRY